MFVLQRAGHEQAAGPCQRAIRAEIAHASAFQEVRIDMLIAEPQLNVALRREVISGPHVYATPIPSDRASNDLAAVGIAAQIVGVEIGDAASAQVRNIRVDALHP